MDKKKGSKAKDKRESGVPGGGAGRRDEVKPEGGIYPFGGTNSPSDAPIVPSGSFGQGERGIAGYEESGSSEITYLSSQPEKCRDIMTKNPLTCIATDTADTAARLMRDNDIGPVPVVESTDKKKLIGIVTDRDLVIRVLAADRDAGSTPIQEVMTKSPAVCSPDDDIAACLDAMERRQVRRMPVVDNRGQLVGIIAQADIALRIAQPRQTAEVVQEISKPRAA